MTYTTRPATHADLDAIVALRNVTAVATHGTPVTADHWQMRQWLEANLKPVTDTCLVQTNMGEVIGYVEVKTEAPYIYHEISGAVHPEWWGQGIGTTLVKWAENRAHRDIAKAPADARLLLRTDVFDADVQAQQLFLNNGFAEVRRFVHLKIEMTEPPPPPMLPDEVEIRPLQTADWAKVRPALEEAFNDHWGILKYEAPEEEEEEDEPERDPAVFNRDYFNSPGLCFVAWAGDEVSGCCLCNAKVVGREEAGYLGSLSIRRPYRRQGIGQALTLHALGEFYRRGTNLILTDTDGDSFTRAYRVYQKAGMAIYRAEIVYEKEIRPGHEWLKREAEE